MLAQYYKLRPDIFIQRAPGKLRIKRQSENYILVLNNDFIDVVLDFLEKADGRNTLDKLMSQYQGGIRAGLEKITHFLVSKNLAFFQSESKKINEPGLSLVENYLSQYTDDTRRAYDDFSNRKFLVVAGDIELHGLTRTLSELGAKDLSFANLQKTASITSKKIIDNFKSHNSAKEADIREVSLGEVINDCDHDVIITTEQSIAEQITNISNYHPTIYLATISQEHLVIQKRDAATFRGDPQVQVSRTQRLVSGAIIGSVIFDDLAGVKTFSPHEYYYYSLNSFSALKRAKRVDLKPVSETSISSEVRFNIVEDLDTLIEEPLFPIKRSERIPHTVDMLNIQVLEIQDDQTDSISSKYFGISLDENDSRVDALESYLLSSERWFCHDQNFPGLAGQIDGYDELLSLHANELSKAELFDVELNRHIEFLVFCIGTAFNHSVVFRSMELSGERYLIAFAGAECAYTIMQSDYEPSLTKLLLRLYLNLWIAENQPTIKRRSAVLPAPLLDKGGTHE